MCETEADIRKTNTEAIVTACNTVPFCGYGIEQGIKCQSEKSKGHPFMAQEKAPYCETSNGCHQYRNDYCTKKGKPRDMVKDYGHRVGTHTKKHGMTKGQEPRIAKQQVIAHGKQSKNDNLSEQSKLVLSCT